MKGMMLHCGAEAVTLDDVRGVQTPDPTETHYPIPHDTLIGSVTEALELGRYEVADQSYGLWKDGARMFGLLSIREAGAPALDEYTMTLGLRNSHDKAFAAGVAAGLRVFVCDNMSFSGDIVVFRKHTKRILNDLDRLVAQSIGQLVEHRVATERRIEAYKDTPVDDSTTVHDLVVRAVDARVMPNSYIPHVLREWRTPSHDAFNPRTAWSLYNAFTEALKKVQPFDLTARTTRLHGLFDLYATEGGHDPNQIVIEAPSLN